MDRTRRENLTRREIPTSRILRDLDQDSANLEWEVLACAGDR